MIRKTVTDTAAHELLRLSVPLSRNEFLKLRPEIEAQIAKNMRSPFELRGIRIYTVSIGEIWD